MAKKRNESSNSLQGWAGIIREHDERERRQRERYPETAKLMLQSDRWGHNLHLIKWLSDTGRLPTLTVEQVEDLSAEALGIDIQRIRQEATERALELDESEKESYSGE